MACGNPNQKNNGETNNGSNNGSNNGTCDPADCDDNAACVGAECVCNVGYTGDGSSCTDADECADGTDDCDELATCANTDGGFTCTCPAGYEGDGTVCSPLDECAAMLDDCDPNAICTDADPGFTCACPAGFDDPNGDGKVCNDVDECADGTAMCDANATCANTPGSFQCTCTPPTVGDGFTCMPAEIVGSLAVDDPGQWNDATYAHSCHDYRFPQAPYVYEGSTGDGFYSILPPGKATPIVVSCNMTYQNGGWTALDAAVAQEFGIMMTDVNGSGGCGFNGDNPTGHVSGALACRYDIAVGFTFDEIVHGYTPTRYDGLAFDAVPEDPVLGWADEMWGMPYCVAEENGDLWWGTPAGGGKAFSVGEYFAGLLNRAACEDIVPVGSNDLAIFFGDPTPSPLRVSVTPDTALRFEFGMNGAADRGWEWAAGSVWVRDSTVVVAP